jgi:hypothetical protein
VQVVLLLAAAAERLLHVLSVRTCTSPTCFPTPPRSPHSSISPAHRSHNKARPGRVQRSLLACHLRYQPAGTTRLAFGL